eukprot:8723482-Lingulodinium_polyedra.AAC.1
MARAAQLALVGIGWHRRCIGFSCRLGSLDALIAFLPSVSGCSGRSGLRTGLFARHWLPSGAG